MAAVLATRHDFFDPSQHEFPQELLTGAAGNYGLTYSQYMESPPSFLYASYLTCLGTVVSFKIKLKSEVKAQPRLYTVLLGESATTRKSTAITKTVGLFKEVIQTSIPWILNGVGSGEGLADTMARSPVVLLCTDEFKRLIDKMKAGILLPMITELYENNTYHSVTRKKSIFLDDVYLAILGASTLETYQQMFTPKFTDIGFINRLFLVLDNGQRKFAVPQMVPEEVKAELRTDLADIIRFVAELAGWNDDVYEMEIEPEALGIFEKWYLSLPQNIFTRRIDSYGLKLMPLLALNEMKKTIDVDIVQKLLLLLEYELKVREYTTSIATVTTIAKLEESIRRNLKKHRSMTSRNLERKCNKNRFGIKLWDLALRNLKESGEIRKDSKVYFWVGE